MSAWLLALSLVVLPQVGAKPPSAFDVDGQVSLVADFLPRRDVAEFRPQASLDVSWRPSGGVRMKLDGSIEALAADRHGYVSDAAIRIREAWIEAAGAKGDVRAGFGRIVWGRLDEVQPSDVINPLDSARFLFDGRSAARLPVAFVRARVFASEKIVVEGVLAPIFRRGTFDELDEASSPFNLLNDLVLPASLFVSAPGVERREPAREWRNVSGGGRVSGTLGRVDVSVGAFRGFEGFGLLTFEPAFVEPGTIGPAVVGRLVERFPRFTMVSADFETVAGEWAWRGEAALFIEKVFNGSAGVPVQGKAMDAGFGVDRRTGEFRVFASAIVHREWSAADPQIARTDFSLVGSIERQFDRERYFTRVFAVLNPSDASAFVRGLLAWRLRDDLSVEASAATFLGDGDDTLARFHTRDFVLARLRWRY